MGTLNNQVAIVTGGARGIGLAIAKRFAGEGADVLIADILADDAKAAAESLASLGVRAEYYVCDVAGVDQIHAMCAHCKNTFGKIDILVNNAGIQTSKPSMQFSEVEFDRLMDVNLKGALFLASDQSTYIYGQTIFCDGGWSTGILPNALDFIRRTDPDVN